MNAGRGGGDAAGTRGRAAPPDAPLCGEVLIAPPLLARILRHAEADSPAEACGILVGDGRAPSFEVRGVVPALNVAAPAERRRRFEIDPRAVIDVERRLRGGGGRLVGFYHSHPEAGDALSPTDLEFGRLWPGTVWLVVPVRGGRAGEARVWLLEEAASGGAQRERSDPGDGAVLEPSGDAGEGAAGVSPAPVRDPNSAASYGPSYGIVRPRELRLREGAA